MARKKENLLGEMKKNVKKVAEQSKDINEKQPTQLSIDKIKVNEGNYFNMNDDSKYEALKLSIERVGILSPLTVKENGVDDKGDKQYLIISGHRRLKAAKELNYETVPVHIIFSNSDTAGLTDANTTSREITFDEYIRAIEEVEREIKENNIKVKGRKDEYIGKRLGLSHNQVSRYRRIKGKLSKELKALFDDKAITLNTASEWAALSVENQIKVYNELQSMGDTDKISEALGRQLKKSVLGIDTDKDSNSSKSETEDSLDVDGVNNDSSIPTGEENIDTPVDNTDIESAPVTNIEVDKSDDNNKNDTVNDETPVNPVTPVETTDKGQNIFSVDDNTGEIVPVDLDNIKKAANVVSNIKRYVDGIQNECNRIDIITDNEKSKAIRQLKMCRDFIEETLSKWETK